MSGEGISPGQFVDHEHVVTLVINEPRAIGLSSHRKVERVLTRTGFLQSQMIAVW